MKEWIRQAGRAVMVLALLAGVQSRLAAQTTTGGITGQVTDSAGATVGEATVVVTNTATGLSRTVTVRGVGTYNLAGLEPGSRYRVQARAIGFQPQTRENVTVRLSQTSRVDFKLTHQVVQLQEVAVTAPTGNEAEFGPNRQGTQTTIPDSLVHRLPTLDRDFTDFAKLAPQVQVREGEGGISAAGQNNRFNTVQVDGATVNDRFGLGRTGEAGGQADGRAVGLEAVQEFQVLLSPYDVRQGNFTGALINAVTKSGTNQLHGSLYGYHRDNSWAGYPVANGEFKNWQYGGSLGGPIIKDRAHFFLDAERREETQPAAGPYAGGTAVPLVANPADVDAVNQALKAKGLAGAGTLDLVNNDRPLTNLLGRVDYQVGASSRLVGKFQYNTANRDVFSRTTALVNPTIELSNNGYFFENKTYNPSLQWITNFANGGTNELIASANVIRDRRTPTVLEPLVVVQNFTQASGTGTYSVRSGSEEFSQGNQLDQDIYELTNNFSLPVGQHNFTLGGRMELYKVRNLFAQNSYGTFQFDNLADLEAGKVEQYTIRVALPGTQGGESRFHSGQFGLYAQDDWDISPTFTVSPGVRVEMPYFTTSLNYDPRVIARFGAQDKPGGQLMVSPRLGFNWTDASLSTNQIRGGVGVFTGSPAFVWYSNAYANNGLGLVGLQCGQNGDPTKNHGAPAFNPDNATNPITQCADGFGVTGPSGSIGEVDLIGKDTKFPQVLRANLAFDRSLGGGFIGTLEGMYTKDINNFFIVNRNLAGPQGADVNGRVVYGTIDTLGVPTTAFIQDPSPTGPTNIYGNASGGVYELRNTSQGYNWNVTGQLRKNFGQNLQTSIGYTYSESYSVQDYTSSRAISNWRFGRATSVADSIDQRTRSSFDRPHRLIASATYTLKWKLPTDVSFTYVGQSGSPYTLITGGASGRGDLNRNGNTGDDPIYIPTGAGDPNGPVFANAAQETAFNQYIDGESCLRAQRGQIMTRNSCRNPWQNQLDMSIRQNLPVLRGNASFELQVFNVLRMLDKDWGLVKTASGDEFYTASILTVTGATAEADAAQRRQVVTFDPNNLVNRFRPVSSTASINRSAYYVQAGIRYNF